MNNIQKAFKNKAKCGLRMAVGGVISDEIPGKQPQSKVVEPAPLSTGSRDLDTLGTDAGSAPKFALRSMSDNLLPNVPYKPGSVGDPYASASQAKGQLAAPQIAKTPAKTAPQLAQPADVGLSAGLRSLRGYADGGVVETPEQLMARMAAKYGTSGSTQEAPVVVAQAQQPVQQAQQPVQQAQQPQPAKDNSGGLFGQALRGLRSRANFADGGVVKIDGPGSGTSDDIPAKVNKGGKAIDINVSNGEALAVLPAKTAQNPDAIDAVNDIIYKTNGKPPRGLRAGGEYAYGSFAEMIRDDAANVTPVQKQSIRQAAANVPSDLPSAPAPAPMALPNVSVQTGSNDPYAMARQAKSMYGAQPASSVKPQAEGIKAASNSAGTSPVVPIPSTQAVASNSAGTSPVVPIPSTQAVAQPNQNKIEVNGNSITNDVGGRTEQARFWRDAAQRNMNLPEGITLVNRGNAGLRALAGSGEAGPMDMLNASHEKMGDGISYSKTTVNGKPQVMISGGQETAPQYVGSDGKPTSKWTDTQTYKDAVAKNEKDNVSLRELQRQNAMSDLDSPNEMYQQRGLRKLGAMLKEDELAATKGGNLVANQLKLAEIQRGLSNDAKASERDARDYNLKTTQDFNNHLDKWISDASIEDGKVNPEKQASLRRYIANIPRQKVSENGKQRDMDNNEYFQHLTDNFVVDNMIDSLGRHYLTREGRWSGEKAKLAKTDSAGFFEALARGAMPGQPMYVDPATNRAIFESDVVRNLSPTQQKLFRERVMTK